jgi:hypothetical protein
MRNPRRDRLEYLLYATVMTGTTVALGLIIVFGKDDHGQKRAPVLNQPLDESLREANLEIKAWKNRKYAEGQEWANARGYGDLYRKVFGDPSMYPCTTANRKWQQQSRPQHQHQLQPPPSFLDGLDQQDVNDKKPDRYQQR